MLTARQAPDPVAGPGQVVVRTSEAVDYSEAGWTGRVLELTAGQGADVVFDRAGGELGAASFGIIARGGRFSGHGMSDGGFARLDRAEVRRRGVTVNGIGAYVPEVFRQRAAAALAAAAAGRIRPVIGQSTRWPARPTRTPPWNRGPRWPRRCSGPDPAGWPTLGSRYGIQ